MTIGRSGRQLERRRADRLHLYAVVEKGGVTMPDREMVVAALECLADGRFCACCRYKPYDDCSKRVARDALIMLKEQQKLIDEITQRRANNGAFD